MNNKMAELSVFQKKVIKNISNKFHYLIQIDYEKDNIAYPKIDIFDLKHQEREKRILSINYNTKSIDFALEMDKKYLKELITDYELTVQVLKLIKEERGDK